MRPDSIWYQIEMPVYILSLWSIAAVLLMGFNVLPQMQISIIGWVMILGIFGWIGMNCASSGPGFAARAGAIAGAVSGFVSGIMGVIGYYAFPHIYAEAVHTAVEAGAPADLVQNMMMIGVYIGLVTAPILSAAVGALISVLTALVKGKK
jgi:hypothetical protein